MAFSHARLIGQSFDATAVRRFLSAFGFDRSTGGSVHFAFFDDYDRGIGCLGEGGVLQSVFYSAGDDMSGRYEGVLPAGLSFEMTRRDVRAHLGPPAMAAKAVPVDRWPFDDCAIAVIYGAEGQITSVALEARGLYLATVTAGTYAKPVSASQTHPSAAFA